jgi:hypothetical protein
MSRKLRPAAVLPLALTLCMPVSWLGCAHPGGTRAPGGPAGAGNVSGVWDWIVSANDEDNNKRIEQEEWHLRQAGSAVEGFYVRTLTVVSGDDNLFRCNGQRRFQKRMRFQVEGQVAGSDLLVREVGVEVEPGPCGVPVHGLQSYSGRIGERSLTLHWDAELSPGMRQPRQQVLYRRPPDQGGDGQTASHPSAFETPATGPAVHVAGTWTWEVRGVGWDGDAKVEQEEWHLQQVGNVLRGYYDRIVTSISSDGHPYRCNQQTQFATVTRYQVEGSVSGSDIQIRELSFEAKPSPCEERPQRRLDVYRGSALGEEIRLSWGTGQQVLRRSRPPVPTSSF